jgi:mannose-6-phosphate isomerase-like protein (cupin superfamily)
MSTFWCLTPSNENTRERADVASAVTPVLEGAKMTVHGLGNSGWIRKILVSLSLMVAGGLVSQGIILVAQNMMTAPGKYISKAQIMKGLDESKLSPLGIKAGQSVQIVPNLVIRRRFEGPNNASIHSTSTDGQDVTEIMEVVDGSGTLMTGGTWVDPSQAKTDDRTKGISGGEVHEIQAGDFVVIPPGTAHWFPKINGHVTIVETRFPGDVTKAQK